MHNPHNLDKEVDDFTHEVNITGVGQLYGLAKGDYESEEEFRERIRSKIESRPKTLEERNTELFALLKDHFMDRLCWWSVSNGGDDFEVELIDNYNPSHPCITIKVYPSGKALAAGGNTRDFGITGGDND